MMNSRRRIGLVLGVVTLLVASVSPAPGAAASHVSGTVTLEGEGPLADVEVFLFDPNQGALFTCTDNQGDYTFVNVSGGVDLVSATGVGTAAGCANSRFLAPDGEKLLNEYYDGSSGLAAFTPFQLGDGPIDFGVERANGRGVCQGLLHTLAQEPTAGDDVLIGSAADDVIAGLGGNDVIKGKGGNDVLCGDGGKDKITPGKGIDYVDGGGGQKDWIIYDGATKAVTVKLNKGFGKGQGRDTIVRTERIVGSDFGDLLIGNGKANTIRGGDNPLPPFRDRLFGKAGDDTLYGEKGWDRIIGGSGDNDKAFGGAGSDICDAEFEKSC